MKQLITLGFLLASAFAQAQTPPQVVPADQLDNVKSAAIKALDNRQLNCAVRGYAVSGGALISPEQLISHATYARIDNSSLPTTEFVSPSSNGSGQIAVWVVTATDKQTLKSVLIINSGLVNMPSSNGSATELTPFTVKVCTPL
jgi:hypothetical protein